MTTTDTARTDDAKRAASNVADVTKDKAADVKQSAATEARSVVDDAKDQAAGVLGTTRSELKDRAAEQTKTLSSTLQDIGQQLGGMADGSDDPKSQMAQLAKAAADTLDQKAQQLDQGGFDGLVDDVKRFARNRPGAFVLGSVAAGFAIGRLAKHADLQQAKDSAQGEVDTDTLKPSSDDEKLPAPSAPPVTERIR